MQTSAFVSSRHLRLNQTIPSANSPRATRKAFVVRAANSTYVAPSSATGSSELEALERFSEVIPDLKLNQNVQSIENAKAATSSRSVIAGIMANPTGVGRYKFAIEQARYYQRGSGDADTTTALQVDKALVNVGALMLEGISGRVSTEIDPRDAMNTEKLIARGRQLVSLYADVGVGKDKILVRMPATWAAIQAAKVLESEGVATHLVCVFGFVQAVAAAQAGSSVLQINVGRLGDWYDKHPGVLRDKNYPLEARAMAMAGYGAAQPNPGLLLVEKVYSYLQTTQLRSKLMASGLRTKAEALSLAGCDFLVVGPRVMNSLKAAVTLEGFNDGLHASSADDGSVKPRLTPEFAAAYEIDSVETGIVDEAVFNDQLGLPATELLQEGVQRLVDDANRLEPLFLNQVGGQE